MLTFYWFNAIGHKEDISPVRISNFVFPSSTAAHDVVIIPECLWGPGLGGLVAEKSACKTERKSMETCISRYSVTYFIYTVVDYWCRQVHCCSSPTDYWRKFAQVYSSCSVDSLLNYVLDFVVSWIEARAVWWPQIWKFIGWPMTMISVRLLHLQSGGSEWCTDCSSKHCMWKRSQKKWKKRSERRKHCMRTGCSKVRTPPAHCHKPTDRTDYNTLPAAS